MIESKPNVARTCRPQHANMDRNDEGFAMLHVTPSGEIDHAENALTTRHIQTAAIDDDEHRAVDRRSVMPAAQRVAGFRTGIAPLQRETLRSPPRRARIAASMLCVALIGLAGAAPAPADDAEPWKVRIPAHARIGTTPVAGAEFEFACRTGAGGAFQLNLILPKPDAIKSFPLDQFEGPSGIGETHKLAEWSVSGGKQPARARSAISGWFDDDAYIFSSVRDAGHPSDLARLARHLIGSGQERLRLVVKAPQHNEALKVEAEIGAHREAVAKILAPCLPPLK
jgi:hypothetical protein